MTDCRWRNNTHEKSVPLYMDTLGTQAQNIQDAARKAHLASGDQHPFRLHPETRPFGDRNGARTMPHRIVRGEQTGNAKLTAENIRTIRRAYARGRKTVRQLATCYGVGRSTISNVIARNTWAHIKQDPKQQDAADQQRRQRERAI